MSFTLRLIMHQRGLTVQQLADMAGVSKSAMEKYLAGPSSPRAVAVASLAKGLDVSTDFLLFGELDAQEELAFQIAFSVIADLLEDLINDPELSASFIKLEPRSQAQTAFVRELALERALRFRRRLHAEIKNAPRIVVA